MTLTGPAPDTEDAEAGAGFTSDEMMTVAASRALRDGVVCFVGIGLPSTAANLARTTHAPQPGARLRVRDHWRQAEPATAVHRGRRIGRNGRHRGLGARDLQLLVAAGPDRRRVPVSGPIGPPRQPEQHRYRALRCSFGTSARCRRGAGDSGRVR